jgi:hypothetical protein
VQPLQTRLKSEDWWLTTYPTWQFQKFDDKSSVKVKCFRSLLSKIMIDINVLCQDQNILQFKSKQKSQRVTFSYINLHENWVFWLIWNFRSRFILLKILTLSNQVDAWYWLQELLDMTNGKNWLQYVYVVHNKRCGENHWCMMCCFPTKAVNKWFCWDSRRTISTRKSQANSQTSATRILLL